MVQELEWLTLSFTAGLGATACRKLVEHFGTPARALSAGRRELAAAPGISQPQVEALVAGDPGRAAKAAAELDRVRELGFHLLTLDDPQYPYQLKNIHAPPPVLYVKGSPAALDCRGLGIVGSRAATSYGRGVAARIATGLAQRGFTIISGLALGIDTEAHKGALAAAGLTVAVLGCGLDIVYPEENRGLFQKISENGAVISEYPLGTKPDGFRFPARNRIISGLSLGVLVVEAAPRSGSLITAGHALEQGREVFAVPGRVDSFKSSGTHSLLKQGAKLVQGIDDILEELPPMAGAVTGIETGGAAGPDLDALDPEERGLFEVLEVYPRTIDEIVRDAGRPAAKISELLLLLELKGMVEALPGKCFRRVGE